MSSSDLSSLSSAESVETDEELLANPVRGGNLDRFFKSARASTTPPPKRKRPASPPHEYVLADNPDIAFLVMFRARFASAFPRSVPNFGPQDIERGVVDSLPDEGVEKLLCGLIGLVLNRKKDVEKGHYTRALEEAISTNSHQWPRAWEGKNPLHGGGSFNNMTPAQRLTLLKSLVLWALNTSDAIRGILTESYKQQRHEDDLNQPLSVQSWGRDGDKRRYWLIEGQDDTHFRLYRESNPALKSNTWWSAAESIDGLKVIAQKLEDDGTQPARRLKDRVLASIPRFEAGEEKRKRRDYRIARKAQFARVEGLGSMYEGRTRGKRIKYTFSDDEDDASDGLSTRRSTRHSGVSTPAEPAGPTFTASGRQVKSRVGGTYGEIIHSGQQDPRQLNMESNSEAAVAGRSTRSGQQASGSGGKEHISGYNDVDEMDDESDAMSSGNEWDGGDDGDDADDNIADDEDEDEDVDVDDEDDTGHKSLVVSFKVSQQTQSPTQGPESEEQTDVVMENGIESPPESIALVDEGPEPFPSKPSTHPATPTDHGHMNGTSSSINQESLASGRTDPMPLKEERNGINGQLPASPMKSTPLISSMPKPVRLNASES